MYLLDTNVLSHLIRNPQGVVANRIASVGEDAVCTSVIVAAELRYGCTKKASPRLTKQVSAVLSVLDIKPLDVPVDRVYGEVRAMLERVGHPIGGNDLLIAAHALALGCTMVTDNEREFRRIEGLKVENWL